MKKVLFVLLALCIATAVALAQPSGTNIGPVTVELKDNFKYGKSYAGDVRIPELMNGYKVMKGDVFTLKVTYTVDRDLEQPIAVGIVDQSAGSGYWNPISYKQPPDSSGLHLSTETPKAGKTYTIEVTMTALKNSPGATPDHNTLRMESIGKKGKPNPIVTFTEFVLTKK